MMAESDGEDRRHWADAGDGMAKSETSRTSPTCGCRWNAMRVGPETEKAMKRRSTPKPPRRILAATQGDVERRVEAGPTGASTAMPGLFSVRMLATAGPAVFAGARERGDETIRSVRMPPKDCTRLHRQPATESSRGEYTGHQGPNARCHTMTGVRRTTARVETAACPRNSRCRVWPWPGLRYSFQPEVSSRNQTVEVMS